MAKILIPFSGGINSLYGLYRWLNETQDEVVAVYAEEGWQNTHDPSRIVREKNAAISMADWLTENVRDFTFEQIEWSMPYKEDRQPIRPGFTNTWNVGIVEPRYRGTAELIAEHQPDGVVWGMSLENTSHDCGYNALRSHIEVDGVNLFLAGSANLFEPVQKGEEFDWESVSANLIGRYQQLEAIPADLAALIPMQCDCNRSEEKKIFCLPCSWQKCREKLSNMTGAEFDTMFALYGSYGKWRNEADQATYEYRGFPPKKFAEILEIDVDWEG